MEREKAYSSRSQAGWQRQRELETELERCANLISMSESRIPQIKEVVERVAASIAKNRPVHPTRLAEATRDLEDTQRGLDAYRDHSRGLRSEINSLERPEPSKVCERLKTQTALGRVAAERLKADRLIGRAIDDLRRMLIEREELSAKMHAAASAIDLKGDPDFLDEARFRSLLHSLPSGTTAASEQWAIWFAGAEQSKDRYVVRREFTLKETLADCHFYKTGDSVLLTKEQAAEVIADHSSSFLEHKTVELQLVDKG
ncbi:MAG: hypothetical protein ACRECH_14955 [Nitrososphaerales archaeon]